MKQMILLSILIVCVLPIATAVPDSVINGPYKISFDLGSSRDAYNVTVNAPVIDETLGGDKRMEYSVTVSNKTEFYRFFIIDIKTIDEELPIIASGSEIEAALKSLNANDPRNSNFQSDTRMIDGMSGAVASMSRKFDSDIVIDVYSGMYPSAFDPKHTYVNILSTYPWNEGTLQVLKTIHIERIQI